MSASTTLTVTSATIQSIEVSLPEPSLPQGYTQPLTATAILSDGRTLDVTTRATWQSAAPSIATISNVPYIKGVVTGVAAGTTQVSASIGPITGVVPVTVSSATLQSIEVAGPSSKLPVGFPIRYVAMGTFSDGTTREIGTHATWSTSNTPLVS